MRFLAETKQAEQGAAPNAYPRHTSCWSLRSRARSAPRAGVGELGRSPNFGSAMSHAKKPSLIPKRRTYYVPHPRYGSQPRITGVDVDRHSDGVYLKCWTAEELESWRKKGSFHGIDPAHIGFLIPGTAILADPLKQRGSCMLNTHYYDIEKKCRDCGKPFIFYAEEQRYWYEELQFPVDADCVRCYPCRRVTQDVERTMRTYEELMSVADPSPDQQASMADYRLTLVQAGRFHTRQLEHVRAFLNRFPDHPQTSDIRCRLATIS